MVARSADAVHFNRRLIFVAAFVLIVPASTVCAPVVRAQSQAQAASAPIQRPSFDVISVKPEKTGCGPGCMVSMQFTADGFKAGNITAHGLLLQAYGLNEGQILGEPAWANSATFDIEAKVAGPDVAAFSKLDFDQRQAMYQQVLTERFKLVAHLETREQPVYALSIAKGGPKFKESAPDPNMIAGAKGPGRFAMGMGMISAHGTSIPYFLSMLSRQLGRTILDRTGLTGNYDFTLRWNPDNGVTTSSNGPEGAQTDALPSIFAALQEQLGLKLESTKAPASVLVIDHLERPSQN
jgi:uncharacterized protein (TIGR03435 family)